MLADGFLTEMAVHVGERLFQESMKVSKFLGVEFGRRLIGNGLEANCLSEPAYDGIALQINRSDRSRVDLPGGKRRRAHDYNSGENSNDADKCKNNFFHRLTDW